MTEYLTPEQAAELLPFGNADWVRIQMRKGKLAGSKVGGRWLTTRDAVEGMVAANTNGVTRRKRRAS